MIRRFPIPTCLLAFIASAAMADPVAIVPALWSHAVETCAASFDDPEAHLERIIAESAHGSGVVQRSADGMVRTGVAHDAPFYQRFEIVDFDGTRLVRCSISASMPELGAASDSAPVLEEILRGNPEVSVVGGFLPHTDLYGEPGQPVQLYVTEDSYIYNFSGALPGYETDGFSQVLQWYMNLSFDLEVPAP